MLIEAHHTDVLRLIEHEAQELRNRAGKLVDYGYLGMVDVESLNPMRDRILYLTDELRMDIQRRYDAARQPLVIDKDAFLDEPQDDLVNIDGIPESAFEDAAARPIPGGPA